MAKATPFKAEKLERLLAADKTQEAIDYLRGHGYPVPATLDYTVRKWARRRRVLKNMGATFLPSEQEIRNVAIRNVGDQLRLLANQPLNKHQS